MVMDESKYISSQVVGSIAQFLAQLYNNVQTHSSKTREMNGKFLKFIYSEKATKFRKISTLLLTGTTQDKSKVEISPNFVAFSENMNFKINRVLS